MRKLTHAVITLLLILTAAPIPAGATDDVRVRTERDDKGNVVYKLKNNGDKNVRVTLQHKKTCASTSTNQEPTEREYWLTAQHSRHLRKVIADSDCRHTYRIVKAEYY